MVKGGADEIQIIRYERRLAADFARLNYQWIEEYFVIEPHDREMLDDPELHIIDPGGEILFAMLNQEVVGTAALISKGDDIFELAKMVVSPSMRGKGIGDRLIAACIEHARNAGRSRIFLLSNTLLTPAIKLYRKHGFIETLTDERSPYESVNIRMELAITEARL